MREDFAVYILSYRRPKKMKTLNALLKAGYSGKWYIVVSDNDDTLDDYIAIYGKDKIKVFNKKEYAKKTKFLDAYFDREDKINVVVVARNALNDIAAQDNINYYLMLDDDLSQFSIRMYEGAKPLGSAITNFDEILEELVHLHEISDATIIGLAHNGAFIGGAGSRAANGVIRRIATNAFLCSTKKRIEWRGRMYEDALTSLYYSQIGEKILVFPYITYNHDTIAKLEGGMADYYDERDFIMNYEFAYYVCPAFPVQTQLRLSKTHGLYAFTLKINERFLAPKIISDKFRKVKA